MTAFDRIERRLPELLDDLAAAGSPRLLRRHAPAARRRLASGPAWSTLERWLPMGVIARPATDSSAAVALDRGRSRSSRCSAAAALVYVGSRRVAVPPPFGLARNGAIVYGTADGDHRHLRPGDRHDEDHHQRGRFESSNTRSSRTTGPAWCSPEADRPERPRRTSIAAADGSEPSRTSSPDRAIKWYDECGVGSTAIVSRIVGAAVVQSMVDMATGHETPLDVDPALGITMGIFRPGHDQVIYRARPERRGAWHDDLPRPWRRDGPSATRSRSRPMPSMRPGRRPMGKTLVYSSWGTGSTDQGRSTCASISTRDRMQPSCSMGGPPRTELGAQYSPDGKRLAMMRFGNDGFRDHHRPGRYQWSRRRRRTDPAEQHRRSDHHVVARRNQAAGSSPTRRTIRSGCCRRAAETGASSTTWTRSVVSPGSASRRRATGRRSPRRHRSPQPGRHRPSTRLLTDVSWPLDPAEQVNW